MQLHLAVAAAFAALFALSTAVPDPRGGPCGDTQALFRFCRRLARRRDFSVRSCFHCLSDRDICCIPRLPRGKFDSVENEDEWGRVRHCDGHAMHSRCIRRLLHDIEFGDDGGSSDSIDFSDSGDAGDTSNSTSSDSSIDTSDSSDSSVNDAQA